MRSQPARQHKADAYRSSSTNYENLAMIDSPSLVLDSDAENSRLPHMLGTKIRRALAVLGPGLVTGASDDDPSGIATYSQVGASLAMGCCGRWSSPIR